MANGTTATTIMNTYGNVTESTCGDRTVTNTYDDDQQLLGLMADSLQRMTATPLLTMQEVEELQRTVLRSLTIPMAI